MIQSIQKIEHVQEDGTTVLLLDYGDFIEEEIEIGAEQQSTSFSPIGAEWGIGVPDGGARRSFSFSRRKEHGSLTAAQSWCYVHPSLMPFNKEGVIQVSIREAPDAPIEVWQMDTAVIQGCSARRFFTPRQSFFSLTTYQVTAGRMTPIGGDFGQCFPINWQTYVISDDLSIIGDDVCDSFPPYVPPAPTPGTPGELVPEIATNTTHLKIVGTGLSLDPPVSSDLLEEDFYPNGLSSFGQPQWRTVAISGFYLVITNDVSEETWLISAVPTTPGANIFLSATDGAYTRPWDPAVWLSFDSFGIGTGTPEVQIA